MMTKRRKLMTEDAIFVLALTIPCLVAVARYVDTAARTSAAILASTQQHRVIAKAPAGAHAQIVQVLLKFS
jgi:hypothetical protein